MSAALVTLADGQVRTDTVRVAAKFGKAHKSVIRALKGLECSDDFSRRNFVPRDYVDERGKVQPMYEMTRNGFTFLAMGFTGKEAGRWKEDYIHAFEKMEQELVQILTSRRSDESRRLTREEGRVTRTS